MTLNTEKCKLINFSRKRMNSSFNYTINNRSLSSTSSYKYLGVHLTLTLSWSTHIATITARASRTLGYLKRNLYDAPQTTRKLAYQTFVRPQLEYAAPTWSPYQTYLINDLEAIQNRAARFIVRDYSIHFSVTSIKIALTLPLLEKRRTISLLCLLHKIVHSEHSFSLTLTRPFRSLRRLHNEHSYQRLFGKTNAFNSSALPQAIKYWNGLPDTIANVVNPVIFRQELSAHFK